MSAAVAEITKSFGFEAAHLLPNVPADHKCARLHGHSFRVELRVAGPIGVDSGWVTDFADLGAAWAPLHDRLDHRHLNEVDGLDHPTRERIAVWGWERRAGGPPGLRMGLAPAPPREACTSAATFRRATP